MKKTIVLILVFISVTSIAQSIKGFGSVKAFLNVNFANSGFASAAVGLEYEINRTFRPEIEFSGFLGSLPLRENTSNGLTTDILTRSFTAINVSFCPKIGLGEDFENEPNKGFFQIIPIYSITKIEAKGTLTTYDTKNILRPVSETERFSEIRHSLGIGIGFYVNLSEKTSDALAFNLYYMGIDFGNSLSNLNFSQGSRYRTKDVLGLGINYYFGFVKKKTKI